MLGTVTIHCHVTSKLVKLQGSRLISGNKAPVWFFDNVLANTFAQEGTKRKSAIELDNREILITTSQQMLTSALCVTKSTRLLLVFRNASTLSTQVSLCNQSSILERGRIHLSAPRRMKSIFLQLNLPQ